MFDDEGPFTFKKMHKFSTADGFVELSENTAEMIKYIANEPSVGLFYIQQHTQTAVSNLINLRNSIVKKSREMSLHTEDLDDSFMTMRSMKECGLPVADEMIREIKDSLTTMSTKQPKKGLITRSNSSFLVGRTTSWSSSSWGRTSGPGQDGEKISGYLTSAFRSAKQKASSLKWPQLESKMQKEAREETPVFYAHPIKSVSDASTSAVSPAEEIDDLPVSSQTIDNHQEEQADSDITDHQLLSLSEKYEEFRADREGKLEKWLGETADDSGEEQTQNHAGRC